MRLILAGNKAQAWDVMRPDDKYLAALPEDLLGHCNCDLVEIGTYWLRPDFKPEEIYYYCKSHNISMSNSIIEMVK